MKTKSQIKIRKPAKTDEASALRQKLQELVAQVRCTIADPVRPEGLRQVLAESQMMLR